MSPRLPGFFYEDNQLYCERLPLGRLAARFGTPLYVYSASAIRERYRIFDSSFRSVPHTICYSVKANSNLGILRLLAKSGSGFDIVSGGELERVRLAAPGSLRKVVFSGVGKTADELALALRAGIMLFNVESEAELEALARCAAGLRRTAPVALRVNPDVPAETHPYISTGLREHKFGIPIASARELYRRAARMRFLKISGVSLHIGSQITQIAPFAAALDRAAELVRQLTGDGHKIRFLDAGGGLGISYSSHEPLDFTSIAGEYARALIAPVQRLSEPRPRLLLEPGRTIVAPAGVLLARVLYHKQNGNKRFTIVDAAMNDLIRPSLYGARHEIVPLITSSAGSSEYRQDVVGPVCETGDFLLRDALLPAVPPGQFLAVLDAGAYGMSLASNYNTRPRPAEVLVDGSKVRLIRRRETIRDLVRSELSVL